MRHRWTSVIAAVALVATSTGAATANVFGPPDVDPADEQHPWIALFEIAVATGIPAAYYWSTKEHQAIDFELGSDWGSWKRKLFSTELLKFDTNPFHYNAVRHPIQGVVDYQIIRTNGFSAQRAMTATFLAGLFWEYFVEYREDPSINDIIFNPAAAMTLGEPLYQIGQLWRGSRLSYADRARTALFSPFDALHDGYRLSKRWTRPSVWRTIDFAAGAVARVVDSTPAGELTATADIDLVANRAYAEGGRYRDLTRTGDWSRIRFAVRAGEHGLTGTALRSRTSWIGRYKQTDEGDGNLLALGSAFTYRNDWLGRDKDRIAIAHLVGAQLQLSRRTSDFEVRWDLAAYVDFALAQALVFAGRNPFPRPPPYYSSLQSDGYIDAVGTTLTTRLRADEAPWHLDVEIDAHAMHQIVTHDRDPDGKGSDTPPPVDGPVTTTGINEQRGLWRVQLTYRPAQWGLQLIAEGAERRSSWQDRVRTVHEVSLGALAQLAY